MDTLSLCIQNNIDNDISEDSLGYSNIAALESYNEAILCGKQSQYLYNQMKNNIKLVKTIKDTYGLENKIKGYDIHKNGIFKKIFDFVMTAIKRLIQTISNFILSISNALSSIAVKNSVKKYMNRKKDFYNGIKLFKVSYNNMKQKNNKNYINKFKVYMPVFNLMDFLSNSDKHFNKINRFVTDINNNANVVNNIMNSISRKKTESVSYFKLALSTLAPQIFVNKAYNDIKEAISFGNSSVASYVTFTKNNSKSFNFSSPSKVVNILFYNTDKPIKTELNIDKYIKLVSPNIISESTFDGLKSFVKIGKEINKKLNDSLATVRKGVSTGEYTLGTVKDTKKLRTAQETYNMIYQYSNITRRFNSFSVGVLLHIYKEYTYHQRYMKLLYDNIVIKK